MNQPIVFTNGEHEVKIYTVRNRDRWSYQLSYHEGGKRERKTFGKVSVAQRAAKLVLNRLAVNGHDAAELSTADMESYVIAKKHVEPTGLPLHVCAETFAQAPAKLAGRPLLDAVEFFQFEFNRADALAKTLPEMITSFAEGRTAMGVHADYICGHRASDDAPSLCGATFGREIAAAACAPMDHAHARGITLFDTATDYSNGACERIVGALRRVWIKPSPRSGSTTPPCLPNSENCVQQHSSRWQARSVRRCCRIFRRAPPLCERNQPSPRPSVKSLS